MQEYKAFTYLIGWSNKNVWYYGVKYKRDCKIEELFTTYFTSSKYVHEAILSWGLPDVIQIRKKFISVKKSLLWEQKVLRRLKVLTDNKNKWLNKNIGGAILFDENIREKMSLKKIGKRWLEKDNRKILVNENLLDVYIAEGFSKWKPKVSGNKNPMYGKKHSKETIEKISSSKRGISTITEAGRKKKSEYTKKNNPMMNEEHKKKYLESMESVREKTRKYPCNDGIIFKSLNDATEKTGMPKSTIAWKCRNKKDGWFYSRL